VRRQLLVAVAGFALVLGGAALAVLAEWPSSSTVETGLLVAVALFALLLAALKIRTSPAAADSGRSSAEPFASPPPEDVASEYPLSSVALARILDGAGETARREGTVEDGIDVVRPALRDTLIGALTQGGSSAESVEDLLDSGGWTDDRVAASVLSEHVDPPDRSIRTRLEAWLFPERAVRRRARRATEAVAVAAEAALPTVPGQTAPRTVPTVTTSLSELQRGVDGRLQRASDPMAIARGPSPPEASTDEEDSE
jgi:hypothetical protein